MVQRVYRDTAMEELTELSENPYNERRNFTNIEVSIIYLLNHQHVSDPQWYLQIIVVVLGGIAY